MSQSIHRDELVQFELLLKLLLGFVKSADLLGVAPIPVIVVLIFVVRLGETAAEGLQELYHQVGVIPHAELRALEYLRPHLFLVVL